MYTIILAIFWVCLVMCCIMINYYPRPQATPSFSMFNDEKWEDLVYEITCARCCLRMWARTIAVAMCKLFHPHNDQANMATTKTLLRTKVTSTRILLIRENCCLFCVL